MTLDQAIRAVEATLNSPHLRVDRKRTHSDETSYLLVVLDTSRSTVDDGPVDNGPRLVDRMTGAVVRITIPEALAKAKRMSLVQR